MMLDLLRKRRIVSAKSANLVLESSCMSIDMGVVESKKKGMICFDLSG